MYLWSIYDEIACHFRRYEPKELETKLKTNGFEIKDSMSFVSLLLPLMFFSRASEEKTREEYNIMGEFKIPPFMNFC
tara:strand:- start:204 stop:434 length:231 start_codon:yes stop_codon:yes gene_type:complete